MPTLARHSLAHGLLALAVTGTAAFGAEEPARSFSSNRQASGVRSFDDARGPVRRGRARVTDKDREWAREYLKERDKNRDGVLSDSEVSSRRLERYDADKNGRITSEELIAYSSGKPVEKRTALAVGGDRDGDGRRSQRLWTAIDKLPEGLPSWFDDKDKNRDGQVAMHEYSRRWDARTLRRFAELDADDNGLVTPAEALEKR